MKIAAVEAIPVRIPRERDKAVGSAGSPTGLEEGAANYRWSSVFPVLYPVHFETALLKITLNTGLVGWGEAQAPLAPQVVCAIVDLLLNPVLLGEDFDGSLDRIEWLWQRMYATMRVRGQTGGFMLDAISGIDLALWDLAGKIQGKPISALIPGTMGRQRVRAYCSGLTGATTEDRVRNAIERQAEGFSTFKLFFDTGRAEFLDLLSMLREQLSPGASLAVDALWRLSPEDAADFGSELDRRNALWLEAPLAPEDPVAHAELARAIRTPLALGESYRTHYELAPFFRMQAMGFVQPDLGRSGLTESLKIARMAADRGIPVVPHISIAMGPQIAAAIHLASALPGCELLEYNPSVFEIANRYLIEPLECRQGSYTVPDRPGLGCDVTFPTAFNRNTVRTYSI
jgi:D-galactarolactone cycloisomerase